MSVVITTTTTTAVLTAGAVTSLAMVLVLTLIALLINKEIIGDLDADWSRRTLRRINVASIPLFIVFAVTVALRVSDLLR